MKQKRILLLGGSYAQIPIIKEAKNRGWYVITCDYLPENPGHKLADKYFNISTTDYEGILRVAREIKPDFVFAYASDPAAPVAAYVSEQLGLPGNPYKSVQILAEKDLFRNFLFENGFSTPQSVTINEKDNVIEKVKPLTLPFIIKPTDSSGSKGVKRIENINQLENAFQSALVFSRKKKVIAEEFIDNEIADLHGDAFILEGEMVFSSLGDHLYSQNSQFNPIGTLWPTNKPRDIVEKINKEVANIIKKCGFRNGGVNIEARINKNNELFIMEIGPRSGGHFVPQAIKYATGFDMVKAFLDRLTGEAIMIPDNIEKYSAYYAIHSHEAGILKKISVREELSQYIKEYHQYLQIGDEVKSFDQAGAAIGIILLAFNSRIEMDYYMANMNKYIRLIVN